MQPWLMSVILKPLLLPFVLFVLLAPAVVVRVLIQRKMRDGKLKRFLLRKAE